MCGIIPQTPSDLLCFHPHPGFPGRLALIPFKSPANRWRKFMSGRRRKRRRLFGDAPEAPRVSPKPYARGRTTRPPTVNRPASAIPLTETCAASETRRVARLRAASCATPASLPLPRAQLAADASVANAAAVCPPRRGSGGGGVARRVFRARCGRRRAGSPRGADAEAKASGSIRLAEVLSGVARKSSERAAPRAAASDNGSVCQCPVRKSGIRVLLSAS